MREPRRPAPRTDRRRRGPLSSRHRLRADLGAIAGGARRNRSSAPVELPVAWISEGASRPPADARQLGRPDAVPATMQCMRRTHAWRSCAGHWRRLRIRATRHDWDHELPLRTPSGAKAPAPSRRPGGRRRAAGALERPRSLAGDRGGLHGMQPGAPTHSGAPTRSGSDAAPETAAEPTTASLWKNVPCWSRSSFLIRWPCSCKSWGLLGETAIAHPSSRRAAIRGRHCLSGCRRCTLGAGKARGRWRRSR